MNLLKNFYWKIRAYVFWKYIVNYQWKNFDITKNKHYINKTKPDFSIGIVTYIARYDRFFVKLIEQLSSIFPEVEIVVMVNGYYDHVAQKAYTDKLSLFLSKFPNVKFEVHEQPESLSKLWNKIILNSSNENVFIFNDDISTSPLLRDEIFDMKKGNLSLINNSWSHFMINKKVIRRFGWFDERLPGIGNEDQDYDFRLIAKNEHPEIVYINKIRNLVEQPTDYSYGKTMKVINNKYSADNWEFLNKKWIISAEKQENLLYSTKFKVWFNPLPKLPTPDFYPEIKA